MGFFKIVFDFRINIIKLVFFFYLKSLILSVFKFGYWYLLYYGFNFFVLEYCMCYEYLEGLGEVLWDIYLFKCIYLFYHLFIYLYFGYN